MPHVSIKHFPAQLTGEAKARLAEEVSAAVVKAFGCRDGAVSIGLAAVEKDDWASEVYRPEIADGGPSLIKRPDY